MIEWHSERGHWPVGRPRDNLEMMSERPESSIRAGALSLSAEERLALAADLIDSVEGVEDQEWADAWTVELERRAEDAALHPEKLLSWEEVQERVMAKLNSQ